MKRFTPNAAQHVADLAAVQKQLNKLRRKAAKLEADERALKSFLLEYFDEGVYDVQFPSGTTLQVKTSSYERKILNQEKACDLLLRAGIAPPAQKMNVVNISVSVKK